MTGYIADLNLLIELSQRLNAPVEAADLYQEAVDAVVETLGADAASLWLVDEGAEWASPITWAGHDDARMSGLRVNARKSLLGKTLRSPEALVFGDAPGDDSFESIDERLDAVQSVVGAPLRTRQGVVLGALFGDSFSRKQAFGPYQTALMSAIANQLSLVLQRSRLVEDLRQMSLRMQAAHETERGRIARHLHDDVGGLVTLLHLGLHAAAQKGLDAEVGAELMQTARAILEGLRDVSSELRPPVLDDVGLEAALKALVNRFNDEQSPRILLQCVGPVDRVTDPVASTAYRVVQEGILNARRHSGSEEVRVFLHADPTHLRLQILDDGEGFEFLREAFSGLQYMDDRVRAVSGTIAINTAPGLGTRIEVDLPLPGKKAGRPRLRETDRP